MDARLQLARRFVDDCKPTSTVVVDDMEDTMERAYEARPERLYLVDSAGVIVHRSGMGPFMYDVDALEDTIKRTAPAEA